MAEYFDGFNNLGEVTAGYEMDPIIITKRCIATGIVTVKVSDNKST